MDFDVFAVKFEAFAMLGYGKMGETDNERRTNLKVMVRNMVRSSLREFRYLFLINFD